MFLNIPGSKQMERRLKIIAAIKNTDLDMTKKISIKWKNQEIRISIDKKI